MKSCVSMIAKVRFDVRSDMVEIFRCYEIVVLINTHFRILVEASIIETGGNSAGTGWDDSHPGLIDSAGLAGTRADVTAKACAVSQTGSTRPYLSMKLAAKETILKVQLAFRTDGYTNQGKNVLVQVGTGPSYTPNRRVCRAIGQLTGAGLVDYHCDWDDTVSHQGQYVILSNDQTYLTICEAKVFVLQ